MGYERPNDSDETLLQDGLVSTRWNKDAWTRRRIWAILLTCSNILIFLGSITLFARSRHGVEQSWLRETSYYYLEKQLKRQNRRVDGSIFQTPSSSRFRDCLQSRKAVDDAWQELERIRTFPITAEDVRGIGKDPELAVKFPAEYGLGDDAYVAQLDIFHQLQCLNLLRHIAWDEFDRDGKTAKRPHSELHWMHVAHCVEILEENLVCNANLDVVTFNWKETQDRPFPDFSANKKCTNAEILVDWQVKNTLPADRASTFTRPPGAKEVPLGDEYFGVFGAERVDLYAGAAHEHVYERSSG